MRRSDLFRPFLQSDREKSEGLPVAPFMDRDKVTKPTAQIGFIKFVLIPMFETVMKVRAAGILGNPFFLASFCISVVIDQCHKHNLQQDIHKRDPHMNVLIIIM